MRRFEVRAVLSILIALPGWARQDLVICGTHPEKWKEELFLHRQAARSRMARLRSATTPVRSANRDAGNIAIIEDSDGIVARRNQFNLDFKTITLTPATAEASRYRFQVGSAAYDDSAAGQGTPLTLDDDASQAVSLPFSFPFFGSSYDGVFVNSDGNLTFNLADFASTDRSMGRLAAGPPRIAPLFMDLDPSKAPQSVRVLAESSRFVVSWVRTPTYSNFGPGTPQTFQLRLYPDGRLEFAYNGVNTDSAVVGISPGGLQGSSSVVSFLQGSSSDYSSTLAERFGGAVEVDIETTAQKFYETHEDAYDYLVIYNNLDISAAPTAVAYESTVRNNRSGYGDIQRDIGKEFGSRSRLQAMINMGQLQQYPTDPKGIVPKRSSSRDTPVTVLAHETGHLFLAYASVRDPNNPNDPHARPMLESNLAHWYFGFNSDASLLEGNRIRDDGPNAFPRFLTTGTVEAYSALDQYLMGFRAPEEVENPYRMFLVTGLPLSFLPRLPQPGVSFDGGRRDIHLPEIMAAEGRRTPDHTVAQRRFRFAFILVVAQGTQPSPDDLARVDAYRTSFETFYRQASSERAFADTSLRRSLRLSAFPASGVLAGETATAILTVQTPPSTPLSIAIATPNGTLTAPASVTIPEGATSASFTITGTRLGVEDLSATPNDTRYDTAYARVQVSPASALRLVAVSGARQAADAGTLPNPVVVRVTDVNNLPYPGVSLQAEASSGGSVTPESAVTDADGAASFRWTPGPEDAPQLRVSVAGAPDLVVQTASDRIVAASGVSAASGAAGMAPNSLAVLYGTNLAAGAKADAPQPWPDTLADVRVALNGRSVPLSYVSDGQINFYVPGDVLAGPAELVVTNPQGSSQALRVEVASVLPAIFFDENTQFGEILISGTSDDTFWRPARRGEHVEIYSTGLGPLKAPAEDDLEHTVATPAVTIAGMEAQVVFSGAVPGSPGLYVVRVQIPDGVPSGVQMLSLSIDGAVSNEVKIGVE